MKDKDIRIVQELEIKLLDRAFRTNQNFLNEVLHDEFQECGSTGDLLNKHDILSNLPNEDSTTVFECGDLTTKVVSESVLINTFTAIKHVENHENVISFRSSVWKFADKGWRMIYHQGTKL